MKHTSTPWAEERSQLTPTNVRTEGKEVVLWSQDKFIVSEGGSTVAKVLTNDNQDAAFIVKAVNNHESLLEALKYMVDNIGQPNSLETRDGFNEARAAIKQAGKE